MKIIKYIRLYNYLVLEEGLNPISACHSIQKIRHMPTDFKMAVFQVIEGKFMPSIEYHDVSLEELINEDKLSPIRAILMLDWIRREPAVAMRYMEAERYRAPQTVSDSDKEKIKLALERLKVTDEKTDDEELNDKSDIAIE